jgi:hypothetical protein
VSDLWGFLEAPITAIVNALHSVLGWLECVFLMLGELVSRGAIEAFNELVRGVGLFLVVLVTLLPNFPAFPSSPNSGVLQWLNWAFPLTGLVTAMTIVISLWVTMVVLRIVARWVKAL